MTGYLLREPAGDDGVMRAVLRNPGKLNAISVAMWGELRALFESLQATDPAQAPRAVLLAGADGHFAAGADIDEFPRFRFDEASLRSYHEDVVAPALQAVLDCDIPIVAQLDGSCVGGGLEIAACCDLRVAGASSRFGVPIAHLGFPMAPGEVLALSRVIAPAVLRELLLEGRLYDADAALARGLVHRIVADEALAHEAAATARRIARLSPHAARINKRTLRLLAESALTPELRHAHFGYAAHPDHREGVTAFIERRPPRFGPP